MAAKIGMALGGGGARGAAHLGVLKHLEEIGIQPAALAGTSAGAAVAALYAFGTPLSDLEKELRDLKMMNLTGLSWSGLGLTRNKSLEALLERHLPEDANLEDAKVPLVVVATDLISGKVVHLHEGNAVEAVLASTAVPGIHVPIERDDMLLVDGGLTENVPVIALRKLTSCIRVGIDLNSDEDYPKPEDTFDVISNAMDIAIDSRTREQLKRHADFVVRMNLRKYSRTNARDFDALVEEGYARAKQRVKGIRRLKARSYWTRVFGFLADLIPIKIPLKVRL